MARGVNKVILVGTLGRDPEMKYAANGNAIANLSIVTSEQWNDKATGQRQEKAEWHRIVIFGKLAEVAGQYLTKGSLVYLEGKLQTRKWQDQNTGQDRYSTEVVLSGFDGKMEMLGGGNRQGGDTAFAPQQQAPQNQAMQQNNFQQSAPTQNPASNPMQNQPPATQKAPDYPKNDFDDDDIPF